MEKCIKCGETLEAGSRFCRFCGCPVEDPDVPQAPQAPEVPQTAENVPQSTLRCAECGKILAPGMKFCNVCGCPVEDSAVPQAPQTPEVQQAAENVPQSTLRCAECGEILAPSMKFCNVCGCPVEDPDVPQDPETPQAPQTPEVPQAAENVPQGTLRCAECGEILAPGMKFCNVCGCPVEERSDSRELVAAGNVPQSVPQNVSGFAAAPMPVSVSAAAGTAAIPEKKNKKALIAVIAGALLIVIIAVVIIAVNSAARSVDGMSYRFDGMNGVYTGETSGKVPNGNGTWSYNENHVRMNAEGEWKNGGLYSGKIEVFFEGDSLGTIKYSGGKWNDGDYRSFCAAADEVGFSSAFGG